jgi:single-strand DNA-binding protein
MDDRNQVILSGRLTRDPQLTLRAGRQPAIADFAIAVNRYFTDAAGTPRKETCFVDVVAFGRNAEQIVRYFQTGKPIEIRGRLRHQQWNDPDTEERRSKHSIVLERFRFVGRDRFAWLRRRDDWRMMGLAGLATVWMWAGGMFR